MLFLVFHLGQDRYMLDVRQIAEVLPLLGITQIPQAPLGVAGIFNYRGTLVPAIDLSQVMLGRPARRRLHTRIVLVQYADDSGATHLLGLIVEKVTETLQRQSTDFIVSGITVPHLGSVATDRHGSAHRIEVNQLLPASVREHLFQQPMHSP
jgi:chemotaxis-related protein WspB